MCKAAKSSSTSDVEFAPYETKANRSRNAVCGINGCSFTKAHPSDVLRHKWEHLPREWLPFCPGVCSIGEPCGYRYKGRVDSWRRHWTSIHGTPIPKWRRPSFRSLWDLYIIDLSKDPAIYSTLENMSFPLFTPAPLPISSSFASASIAATSSTLPTFSFDVPAFGSPNATSAPLPYPVETVTPPTAPIVSFQFDSRLMLPKLTTSELDAILMSAPAPVTYRSSSPSSCTDACLAGLFCGPSSSESSSSSSEASTPWGTSSLDADIDAFLNSSLNIA